MQVAGAGHLRVFRPFTFSQSIMGEVLLHRETTQRILWAFFATYNALGWGFPESVYANALPIFLQQKGLSFRREVLLPVRLGGLVIGEFRTDLIVEGKVIVELKACEHIVAAHEAQLLSYLRASSLAIGLLLNFGPKPELRRLIWTDDVRVLRDH